MFNVVCAARYRLALRRRPIYKTSLLLTRLNYSCITFLYLDLFNRVSSDQTDKTHVYFISCMICNDSLCCQFFKLLFSLLLKSYDIFL